jgi:hypothetical protein
LEGAESADWQCSIGNSSVLAEEHNVKLTARY